MTKFLLLPLVALISATYAPAASAANVAALDCLGSNGVTIKGEAGRGDTLRVATRWGLFRKDFIATLSTGPDANTTYVNLDSEGGTDYILALGANPAKRLTQKSTGSILQVSSVRGVSPALIAFVACDIRFSK